MTDRASFAGRGQVVASYKGTVVGKLTYKENGDAMDCSKMGVAGKSIPPHIDGITDMEGDAEFILLVEKDAAFMRLAEDRFYEKYPCAIITAKGQPDVGTRLFLKKVSEELDIPVLALMDSDPYGLKILSVSRTTTTMSALRSSKNVSDNLAGRFTLPAPTTWPTTR